MTTIDALLAERERVISEGDELAAALSQGAELTEEQRATLRAHAERLREIDEQIVTLRADQEAASEIRAAAQTRPPLYGDKPAQEPEARTIGEQFVRSEAYRSVMATFPDQMRIPDRYQSPAAAIKGGLRELIGVRTATERARMRALVSSSDSSAGDLVRPDWRGLLEPGLWAPVTLTDLVTTIPTTSDAIQWVREVSHAEAAAPTPEATAATGTSGTKPEGSLVFDVVTDSVKTIAVWIPSTKRILADAAGLAAYIDQYLRNDVRRELEEQMLTGDGTGENFTGLLNAGIQTQGADSGPFYALRKARAKVERYGRTSPTAILAHPDDVAAWDLAVINNEVNHFVATPSVPWGLGGRTIWGMRVIESEFVPAGTALVGDFRYAVLFDRESTQISVGTINDDFVRNIVRVLAEMRAGFGVIRPNAFCATTV